METFLIVILILVIVEIVGFKVYKTYKKKKKDALTVSDLGGTADDLQMVLILENEEFNLYERCAEAAGMRGNIYQSRFFTAMGKSKEIHIQKIEELFTKRGGMASRNGHADSRTVDTHEEYTYDECLKAAAEEDSLAKYQDFYITAKRNKQKDAVKLLKFIVQTELQNKDIVKKVISGAIPRSTLLYVCIG